MRTGPASSAESPSRPAMLKTVDPTTTPTPVSLWPVTIATTADEISGASAPSAVRIPTNASENPSRSPIRSSSRASTMLDATVSANAPTKSKIATGIDTDAGAYPPSVADSVDVPATVIVGAPG